MTLEKDDPQIELTDDQIAGLKKAIADLAEGKRVQPDIAGSENSGTDSELLLHRSDADAIPPLSQIEVPTIINRFSLQLSYILRLFHAVECFGCRGQNKESSGIIDRELGLNGDPPALSGDRQYSRRLRLSGIFHSGHSV